MYAIQLVLGIAGFLVWGALVWWWIRTRYASVETIACFLVSFMTWTIIGIAGSVYLMGALDPSVWDLIGTGGRGVVVILGALAWIEKER